MKGLPAVDQPSSQFIDFVFLILCQGMHGFVTLSQGHLALLFSEGGSFKATSNFSSSMLFKRVSAFGKRDVNDSRSALSDSESFSDAGRRSWLSLAFAWSSVTIADVLSPLSPWSILKSSGSISGT